MLKYNYLKETILIYISTTINISKDSLDIHKDKDFLIVWCHSS